MRVAFHKQVSWFKPVLAGLLALLMLAMTLVSASNRLHSHFHAGDDHGHESIPCPVCSIAKGQVDAPVVPVSEVFASLSVAWTLPADSAVIPTPVEFLTVLSRGPPASGSSQS